MDHLSAGDIIALCGVLVALALGSLRELRTMIRRRDRENQEEALLNSGMKLLTTRLEQVVRELQILEEKRQDHELTCAKLRERTAATLQHVTEHLTQHSRFIEHLQAQMRNVATGAVGQIVEITRRPPGG